MQNGFSKSVLKFMLKVIFCIFTVLNLSSAICMQQGASNCPVGVAECAHKKSENVKCEQVKNEQVKYEQVESKKILDLLRYVLNSEVKNKLVIFDVDGVVMIPRQFLGNDPWAYYEGDKFIAKYNNGVLQGASKEAFKKGMEEFKAVWSYVQNNVEVRLVENEFIDVLKALEEKGVKFMGFTARGMDLVERTKYQMSTLTSNKSDICDENSQIVGHENLNTSKSVDQYFVDNAYCNDNILMQEYINKNGILFVNLGVSKGEILKKFFEKICKCPSEIVFVDDQPKNIKTIGDMCKEKGINFVGIRYSGADEMVALDDTKKKICDVQLEHLRSTGEVLSDQQALEKLQ